MSSASAGGAAAVRPGPVPGGLVRRFTRGKEQPRGVVWFGARSFWGHLRHLLSAAIASENIDSRDWMKPDDPRALTARIVETLGGDPGAAETLTGGMGRDVYLDFVADTGDGVAVSRAVARLVFAPYELPDPDHPGQFLAAPRGDILFFGGDTAYPVATAREILNRVVVPWNQVLEALPDDGRRRVLLGIPGNHDWYDGLDGFCRMFRRRPADHRVAPPVVGISDMMMEQYARWAASFVHGAAVDKPDALVLAGYTAVQDATHFALRLAPRLDLLAADRQLTTIDVRQRAMLRDEYQSRPDTATLVILPDPVLFFGDPSKTGTQMVEALQLDLVARDTFVLSGDLHHYERVEQGKMLHVIAGGGGAFLHPARIARGGVVPRVAWPGVAQSRLLLRDVPLKLALGRSGFIPHMVLLVLYAPLILLGQRLLSHAGVSLVGCAAVFAFLAVTFALIGGVARRKTVLLLALAAAAIAGAIPIAASWLVHATLPRLGLPPPTIVATVATLVVAVFLGTLVFGAYLTLLTLGGYEHMQALTALDHPGFKHFVRLRVRADGRGVDGWCIGAADPLGQGQAPVLVDQFAWRPVR